ncbi:dual specificity protein phosphatase 22 isoform X5 [Pezoporus wallicus]|uniref:dual specificity protein phosphatase 22 isoform X5 n=1 Tax=Pezoporus wallicus TaxID=35540 RepID=UPI00254DEE1D|nr:dual specificity protein phosphatase 22 isoform X5 [Pezoporus wallicus]XP_061305340.1 dual specificity protein phosphatase 22 isoform X5 [Pezoporus flaviventris]
MLGKLCPFRDMNWILPGLFVGNFKDARDVEQLSKNNITHILSIHDSARPMVEGMKYLCIPAADSPSQNLARHFRESIKFIHECRLRGEGCLVHCVSSGETGILRVEVAQLMASRKRKKATRPMYFNSSVKVHFSPMKWKPLFVGKREQSYFAALICTSRRKWVTDF